MNAKPVVKWAGGKRQLIDKLIEYLPTNYNKYFEPFVGGGALLFHLMPDNAVINDVNQELLAIYRTLASEDGYLLMLEDLKEHEEKHSEDYYYEIREADRNTDFESMPLWKRASRAIYLNKSCFNGLYRVNSKGHFNVPSGKKTKVNTYDIDNIKKLHDYFKMKNVSIMDGDFSEAVEGASAGDFVYFDPPYDSYDDKDSFTAYTRFNFSRDDQVRLAEVFRQLDEKGVFVMLSNHNTKLINELYQGFNIYVVNAKRMINSNSKGRGNVEEVIITNY